MTNSKLLTVATLALLLLASCGSGGLGDIDGGGASDYEIRGTVDSVDTANRVVYLTNVSGYGNMLSNGGSGNSVRVYFDDNTTVAYEGQTYRVADLERGDEVSVRVDESGNQLHAESMTVLRDVSYGTSGSSSSQMAKIRGTVRSVDTSRRTLELESATWLSRFDSGTNTSSRVIVSYGANTSVEVSGRLHPVSGLERGDVIEVQVANANATTPFAERIWLVRDVRN
jgi:hypothetical protein